MSNEVRPFYCGSQYGDWTDANCRRCVKGTDRENLSARCPCDIEEALLDAYCSNGKVSLPIAERMRAEQRKHSYIWQCGEFQAE